MGVAVGAIIIKFKTLAFWVVAGCSLADGYNVSEKNSSSIFKLNKKEHINFLW
jgi:hypothetical protein